MVKNAPAISGDSCSIPGLERSPGRGNGNPLQYYCMDNSVDRGTGRLQSMGSEAVGHNCAHTRYNMEIV